MVAVLTIHPHPSLLPTGRRGNKIHPHPGLLPTGRRGWVL